MSGYYGKSDDFAFKVPAVPSRYQRPHSSNQSTYNQVSTGIFNIGNSESHLNKLQEKIEILSKIYSSNDEIWEKLINNLNDLCFYKLRERCNGGSICPSVYSQNIRSIEGTRNNYSQSTVNMRDYRDQPDYQRSELQNRYAIPVSQELEPEYIPSEAYITQNKAAYEPQSVPKLNPGRNSRQRRPETFNDKHMFHQSELYVPTSKKRTENTVLTERSINSTTNKVIETSSRITSTKQKRTKVDTIQNTLISSDNAVKLKKKESSKKNNSGKENFRETVLTSPNLNALFSEDDNDSLSAFFQKRAKSIAKKTSTDTHTKNVTKSNRTNLDVSVILNRVELENQLASQSQKRKASQTCESSRKRQCLESNEDSSNSDQTTIIATKNSDKCKKKVTAKRVTKATKKRTATSAANRINGLKANQKNANEIKEPKNKEKSLNLNEIKSLNTKTKSQNTNEVASSRSKAKSQKIDVSFKNTSNKKDSISSPAPELEDMEDGSFFGDVSSIVGNESVSFLHAEKRKQPGKEPTDNDMPLHFFSPYANVRSTSGFSAISTPLSKSVAKNVLGKRLKKPNVVAELKDQLKPTRNRKYNKIKPAIIQPVHETTATTESECEASDFSDTE